jgi:hypothetical protein
LLKDKGSFRRIVQQPTIQKDYKHIKVSKFGYFFGLKDEGSAISFGSKSIQEELYSLYKYPHSNPVCYLKDEGSETSFDSQLIKEDYNNDIHPNPFVARRMKVQKYPSVANQSRRIIIMTHTSKPICCPKDEGSEISFGSQSTNEDYHNINTFKLN